MKFQLNKNKLANQVKLCRRNLKSNRVKICATCPFEEIIVAYYPELQKLFHQKRDSVVSSAMLPAKSNTINLTTLPPDRQPIHNCWHCGQTENACFNKRYPPKDGNEGRDCHLWIPEKCDDGQL